MGKVVQRLGELGILREITGGQRGRLFAYDEYLKILGRARSRWGPEPTDNATTDGRGCPMYYDRDSVVTMLRYGLVWEQRGQPRIAGYFACAALERMLPERVQGFSASRKRPPYWTRVEEFCRLNDGSNNMCDALKECAELRGNFLHKESTKSGALLLRDLCRILGIKAASPSDQDPYGVDHYEDHRYLDKKLSQSRKDQGDVIFCGFSQDDFKDLFRMRRTIGALARTLEKHFPQHHIPLRFDHLSDVNPTSAYVWGAAVRRLTGDRPKLEQPSVSLLATTSELRVYLEFGGRCPKGRRAYYQMLREGKLDSALEGLGDDYRAFDIEWYFAVVPGSERSPAQFVRYLKEHPDEVQTAIARLHDEKKTLTWNRFLVGRFFSKEELLQGQEEVLPEVLGVFECLYKHVFRHIEA